MKNNNFKLILIIIILFFTLTSRAFADEQNQSDWREELIIASQALENENNKTVSDFNQLGMVFSTFGSQDNLVNVGVRFAPALINSERLVIRAIGEVFYLQENKEIASFLSLSFEPFSKIYLGGGAELTDKADYHGFIGYNISENIFLEARYIDNEESEVYPFAGLQISF